LKILKGPFLYASLHKKNRVKKTEKKETFSASALKKPPKQEMYRGFR